MIQIIEPEYYIKIGIKDGKVVETNWEDMFSYDGEEVLKKVIKYLKESISHLQDGIDSVDGE